MSITNPPRSSLWRNTDYLLLWSGQTVSAIGSQLSGFVLPLLVLVLTGSPAQAGLIGALEGVPYLVLSLPAGALADRWNRKSIMIVCDAVRAVNMFSVPLAFVTHHLSLPHLYAVALIEGSLFVFFNVAETASLIRVVGHDQLPSAIARQETTWGISALVGPAAAGFLYQAASAALPFLADGCSYALSAVSLTAIRTPFQAEPEEQPVSLVEGTREALAWLWRQPLLRIIVAISAAGDLLFSGIGLIPMVIARQEMHARPLAIGLIFTLAAIGAIAGSSVAGAIRRRVRFSVGVIGTEWIVALLYPLLALAPNPLALGLIRSGMSATVSVSNTYRLSYQIGSIPDALQGRVNSLTTLIAYGSLPVGEALTGVMLQTIGPTSTVLAIAGCVILLATATTVSRHVRQASVPVTGGS